METPSREGGPGRSQNASPSGTPSLNSSASQSAMQAMTRSGMEVPPTGRKVDYRGMDVIPIRDGLVARKDVYSDSVTLLRQLGLTEIA